MSRIDIWKCEGVDKSINFNGYFKFLSLVPSDRICLLLWFMNDVEMKLKNKKIDHLNFDHIFVH